VLLHGGMNARLVVSLSDIEDPVLPECTELAAELDARGLPLSLLVQPRPSSSGAVHRGSSSWRWIDSRVRAGDSVVLQGDDSPVLGRAAEFASARGHEARLRLVAAVRKLGALALNSDSFAPPRWSASAGTRAALRELGFEVCADLAGVLRLRTGEMLRGRVLASTQGVRTAAERAARRGWLVQLAVHASDLRRAGSTDAVLHVVQAVLRHGAVALRYPDLALSR
jgi:predicted deacetylase